MSMAYDLLNSMRTEPNQPSSAPRAFIKPPRMPQLFAMHKYMHSTMRVFVCSKQLDSQRWLSLLLLLMVIFLFIFQIYCIFFLFCFVLLCFHFRFQQRSNEMISNANKNVHRSNYLQHMSDYPYIIQMNIFTQFIS